MNAYLLCEQFLSCLGSIVSEESYNVERFQKNVRIFIPSFRKFNVQV
jgi:hypothetical protein